MAEQLLALRSWTAHVTVHNRRPAAAESLWRAVTRVVQWSCGVRGHATIRCSDGNHLMLRCMNCGHTTSGWSVGRQAIASMPKSGGAPSSPRTPIVEPMSWGWLEQ
jgi:hypothetical protein